MREASGFFDYFRGFWRGLGDSAPGIGHARLNGRRNILALSFSVIRIMVFQDLKSSAFNATGTRCSLGNHGTSYFNPAMLVLRSKLLEP